MWQQPHISGRHANGCQLTATAATARATATAQATGGGAHTWWCCEKEGALGSQPAVAAPAGQPQVPSHKDGCPSSVRAWRGWRRCAADVWSCIPGSAHLVERSPETTAAHPEAKRPAARPTAGSSGLWAGFLHSPSGLHAPHHRRISSGGLAATAAPMVPPWLGNACSLCRPPCRVPQSHGGFW